jgi:hypothetical protein
MEREKIIGFLDEIGIQVIETELSDDCFLPGLAVKQNMILMDPKRMKYAGDLLHGRPMETNWPLFCGRMQL